MLLVNFKTTVMPAHDEDQTQFEAILNQCNTQTYVVAST